MHESSLRRKQSSSFSEQITGTDGIILHGQKRVMKQSVVEFLLKLLHCGLIKAQA
jgi:hypothetical protein